MIVTIDGPSGTGKSTVARRVAKRLGIPYFDTGAMYRAVTWLLIEQGVDLADPVQVAPELKAFSFSIRQIDKQPHYFVGSTDVTGAIRTQKINKAVSAVSAMEIVREKIWAIQRASGEKQSAVFEGRDMGSVVFPQADVKIFLDASPQVRAKRRLDEMRKKWPGEAREVDEKAMEEELNRRDAFDSSRALAPLTCPKGAVRIDTTELAVDEVVEKILMVIHKRMRKKVPAWLHAKKMHPLYRAVLCVAWTLLRLLYRHRIYGLEHSVSGAAILAPNHTSYLDPPLVAVSWPREIHFLAREGLFRNRLFGGLIRRLNSHPVGGDVGDLSVFKAIIDLLKEGKQLVLFPEGRRTEGQLAPIKPGIGMLVMRAQALIVPTYIHGSHEAWGRNRKLPRLFGKTAVIFGSPIPWDRFAYMDKREAQEAIAEVLHASILKLKEWYEGGCLGIPP